MSKPRLLASDIDQIVNQTIKDLNRLWLKEYCQGIEDEEFIRAIGQFLGFGRQWYKWDREQRKKAKTVFDAALKEKGAKP